MTIFCKPMCISGFAHVYTLHSVVHKRMRLVDLYITYMMCPIQCMRAGTHVYTHTCTDTHNAHRHGAEHHITCAMFTNRRNHRGDSARCRVELGQVSSSASLAVTLSLHTRSDTATVLPERTLCEQFARLCPAEDGWQHYVANYT